jgi:hypothetical protein
VLWVTLTLSEIQELGTGVEMFAINSRLLSSSSKARVYSAFDTKVPTMSSWTAALTLVARAPKKKHDLKAVMLPGSELGAAVGMRP